LPYKMAVETVTSGAMAISLIEDGEVYDIIFMDHMMPDMDGIETTRALRNMGYKHPIVALTANAIKGMRELFHQSGFDGFVSKPINQSRLDSYLQRFVAQKQPQHVRDAAAEVFARDASPRATPSDIKATSNVNPDLMRHFVTDAQKAIGAINDFLAQASPSEADFKSLTIAAHSMSSALAAIDQSPLAASAKTLEATARAHDMGAIEGQASALVAALETIVGDAALGIPSPDSITIKNSPEDTANITKQLEILHTACNDWDLEAAEKAITAILSTKIDTNAHDAVHQIKSELLRGDFDAAASLARGLMM